MYKQVSMSTESVLVGGGKALLQGVGRMQFKCAVRDRKGVVQ